jgi:feruloyl esterase
LVKAGEFQAPGQTGTKAGNAALFKSLPAFCRVAATIKPSSDSDIKMEVWMPVNWNGKFQAVGNGGWTGSIAYPAMARALAKGYATASTNTGHDGERASFAIGHPEKVIDFAWRAVHETVVQSKALISANYGSAAKYSYWNGCSSGGKQGLKEAQRFPDDFDGLITGAPANNWIHQKASVVAVAQAVHKTIESFIPPAKYPMIHEAVLAACDRLDGVKDGILEDPRVCKFDPKALLCKTGDGPSCLTAPQVEAARKILAPSRNPRTGAFLFPGLALGTELAWAVQAGEGARTVAEDLFSFVVFENPQWDYRTLDLDKDVALADKVDERFQMAAVDPNLKPLFSHKGKLLMYHGWSDPNIVPGNSINYYKSVVDTVGEKTAADSIRLFMVPGMGHCNGGEGPNQFDMVTALEQWVEQGKAPERILASRERNGAVDRTRPLCPYPQVAQYKGSGSTDEAASFSCAAPRKR